jgi:heme/copper-type cytochrome/quinol oxidase subunit 2
MKRFFTVLIIILIAVSCASSRYIYDEASIARQKKLKGNRAGNVIGDAFLTTGSIILAAFTGVYISYIPEGRNFKKVTLQNTSDDTLQVNMVTDVLWSDSIYCDFMDIRIPPQEKCRILVPEGAIYNVYFRNTLNAEDDEMVEMNTSARRKLVLYPGMTSVNNF